MPKATIQYLLDAGFRKEQFGAPSDFDQESTGYLARVLEGAESVIRSNVGSAAYDAVTDEESVAWHRLRRAEECAARAELWSRRAAFIDGSSVQAMDKAAWQERKEYQRSADVAAAECASWLDAYLAGAETPEEVSVPGLSGAVVVSGPWQGATA